MTLRVIKFCSVLYSHQQLQELFDNDDRFASAKDRIQKCDCLIIDEVGMLSAKIFDMIDSVCCYVRKNKMLMQIVASGNFKQLPPVPNYRLHDDGSYCFTSPEFQLVFPHHIYFDQVVRQDEPDLVKAVNELCNGSPSPESLNLLRSLSNPLPANVDVVKLYGINFDNIAMNQDCLDNLGGQQYTFKATDEGPESSHIQKFQEENVQLKKSLADETLKHLETERKLQSREDDLQALWNRFDALINIVPFCITEVMDNKKLIKYYTGYCRETFLNIYKFLVPND
ncbi:hypothetical protein FSP39_021721 [Pinctada imbricata]|uniref:ATP-dependent DNA helicase n=1 Tax=Pinctada imbricata TaxID=66713 RepID=A0AA88YQR3_PINIB|nr:hypothetical protein FSP39_021721 [Pinctada imbricata]